MQCTVPAVSHCKHTTWCEALRSVWTLIWYCKTLGIDLSYDDEVQIGDRLDFGLRWWYERKSWCTMPCAISSYIFPSLPLSLFLSAFGAIKHLLSSHAGQPCSSLGPLKVLASIWIDLSRDFSQINILYAAGSAATRLPNSYSPRLFFFLTKKTDKVLIFPGFS